MLLTSLLLKPATLTQMNEERLKNTESAQDDVLVIKHREAADTLIDQKKYKYLLPFFSKGTSLTEAAKAANVKTNLMYYHVQRLLSLGLLKEVGERSGRGRKGKLYRVSAKRFFVPLEYTSLENMEAVLYQLEEPLFKKMIHNRVHLAAQENQDLGMGFELRENGNIDIALRPQSEPEWSSLANYETDDFPAVFSKYFVNARLDKDTAKEIQRDMLNLFQKITNATGDASKHYYLNLAIVPIKD